MSGSLTGFGADHRLADAPQAQCNQPHGGDPQHQGAAGLFGKCGERAGLVGVAAGTERQPQDDEGDEQVQDTAGREAGARRVLERLVVGCLADNTVY